MRVGLARSFHNAAVADARRVRRRHLVRALHLAGFRALPQHFDIDTDSLEGPAGPRRDLPLVERRRGAPSA